MSDFNIQYVANLARVALTPDEEQRLGQQLTNILGYIDRVTYDELINTCSCMFYHSQEERHLHYHPLEAIVSGMPLVFMSGGLLEKCGGSDQPGLCRTYGEAREKIKRLQSGDQAFRQSIQKAQTKILELFDSEYCTEEWKKNFLPHTIRKLS